MPEARDWSFDLLVSTSTAPIDTLAMNRGHFPGYLRIIEAISVANTEYGALGRIGLFRDLRDGCCGRIAKQSGDRLASRQRQ